MAILIFEVLQRGEERLTHEEQIHVLTEKLGGMPFDDVQFKGGSHYTNPLNLAGELEDGSYLLFIKDTKTGIDPEVYEASAEIRRWLLGHRHDTSYEAIEKYKGRH